MMHLLLYSCKVSLLRGHSFECHSSPPASSTSAGLCLWNDASRRHLPPLLQQDTWCPLAVDERKQGQL